MNLDGYDIALLVFQCAFLLLCCIGCYGIEVLSWTTWLNYLNLLYSPTNEEEQVQRIEATATDAKQVPVMASGVTNPGGDVAAARTRNEEPVPNAQRVKLLHVTSWVLSMFWVLSIIPAFLQANKGSTRLHDTTLLRIGTHLGARKLKINPDIGGVGVRAGLYITVGLAIFLLLIGHFHKESGAKEIGAAQFLSRHKHPFWVLQLES